MILQHRPSKTSKVKTQMFLVSISKNFLFFNNTYHEAAISFNSSDTDFHGILNKTETVFSNFASLKQQD